MTPASSFHEMIHTLRPILFRDSPILLLQGNLSPCMILTLRKVNMFRGKRIFTLQGSSFQFKTLSLQFSSLHKILVVAGQALSLGCKKTTNLVDNQAISSDAKTVFLGPKMRQVVQSQVYLLQSQKSQREVQRKSILPQAKKSRRVQGQVNFLKHKRSPAQRVQ